MLAAVTNVFIDERKQKFSEWIPNIITSEFKVCCLYSNRKQESSYILLLNKTIFISLKNKTKSQVRV
jgi:hypothetical protein